VSAERRNLPAVVETVAQVKSPALPEFFAATIRNKNTRLAMERQSGWDGSDNQDENLVSRRRHDCRWSMVGSSGSRNRKQGL